MAVQYKKKHIAFILLIFLGIFLRFFVMTMGYNYDFESYCIVGEISGRFGNVYAETHRYNYGPIFLIIQGFLYRISYLLPNWKIAYRILMVSTLSFVDLGITYIIADRYDANKALFFFLNPVSIIITGYHNQFDNIAVLLALMTLYFYNDETGFNRKDVLFVVFLSLSLITKHILFALPIFILFNTGLPMKKKLFYMFIPPIVFLASFLPFALQSNEALNGILNNVFLYRSFNNSPLFRVVFKLTGFPMKYSIIVFGMCMALIAIVTRDMKYEKQLFLYLIALVAFSSAIANQYLIIPIAAIICLRTGILKHLYLLSASIYLMLNGNGLGLQDKFVNKVMPDPIVFVCKKYTQHAYSILAWILFILLCIQVRNDKKVEP